MVIVFSGLRVLKCLELIMRATRIHSKLYTANLFSTNLCDWHLTRIKMSRYNNQVDVHTFILSLTTLLILFYIM